MGVSLFGLDFFDKKDIISFAERQTILLGKKNMENKIAFDFLHPSKRLLVWRAVMRILDLLVLFGNIVIGICVAMGEFSIALSLIVCFLSSVYLLRGFRFSHSPLWNVWGAMFYGRVEVSIQNGKGEVEIHLPYHYRSWRTDFYLSFLFEEERKNFTLLKKHMGGVLDRHVLVAEFRTTGTLQFVRIRDLVYNREFTIPVQ